MNSLAFHLRVGPRDMRWLVVASLVGLMAPAHAATTGSSVSVDCVAGGAPEAVNHCKTDQASALAQVRKPRAQRMLTSRIRTKDGGVDAVFGDYSSQASFTDLMTVVPAQPQWTGNVFVTIGMGVHARLQRSVLNIDVDLSSPWLLGGRWRLEWIGGPMPAGIAIINTGTGLQLDARSVDEVTWVNGGFRAYFGIPLNRSFTQGFSLTATALSNGFVDSWLQFAYIDLDTYEPQYGRLVTESGYRYRVNSVPEPESWAMFVAGLAMLGALHRCTPKRRRHQS